MRKVFKVWSYYMFVILVILFAKSFICSTFSADMP